MTIQELYKNIGGDYEDAIARLVDDKYVKKYIKWFLTDTSFDELINAKNNNLSSDDCFKAAHTFKGVCLNLSLTDLLTDAIPITDHYRPNGRIVCENLEEHFGELARKHKIAFENISQFAAEE